MLPRTHNSRVSRSTEQRLRLLRGDKAILNAMPLLEEFARRCGETHAFAALPYFLSKPGLLRRTPVVLLLTAPGTATQSAPEAAGLTGVVLLQEYRLAQLQLRMYSSNDRSGRLSLLALPGTHSEIAWLAARHLLGLGARAVLITHSDTAAGTVEPSAVYARRSYWTSRVRSSADSLPLAATFDATLATIGQKTRANIRYYRRKAERELGCTFLPTSPVTEAELQAFNRQTSFAMPDRVALWRLRVLSQLAGGYVAAMRDNEGRLLGIIGGYCHEGILTLLWQMNRDDLPAYSLSLVARGYLIEHAISEGCTAFRVEGGTSHPLGRSFKPAPIVDLAVLRHTPTGTVVRRLVRHLVPPDNEVAHLLSDPATPWQRSVDRRTRSRKLG